MAQPINHDTRSSLATAGWETAKVGAVGAAGGGVVGTLGGTVVGAIGSVIAALPLTATLAGVGALIGWAFAAPAAGALIGAALIAVPGALAGAAAGGLGGVTYGGLGGGLLGLFKGGNRVSREKAEYKEQVAALTGEKEKVDLVKQTNRDIDAMNTYYTMGVRDTEARIDDQIPEMLQAAYIKGGQDMKEQIEKTAPMPRPKEHAHAHAHPHPKDHPAAPVAEHTGAGGDWSPAPAERPTGGGGDWANHVAPKSISPEAIKAAAEKAATEERKRG